MAFENILKANDFRTLAIYSWPKQKGWLEEPRPI